MAKNGNIFILWYQGKAQMPTLVKLCFDSVLRNSNGHKVVLLDNSNIFNWIDPFPPEIQQKFDSNIFPVQIMADLIRLSLLSKYGGLWLDATVYVSEKIPDEIFRMPFFTVIREEAKKYDISGISTFSLGRNVKNKNSQKLFDFSQKLLMEYIEREDNLMNYLLIENIMNIGISNDESIHKIVDYFWDNKKNILGLEKNLNKPYDSSTLHKLLSNNLFNKLNFHTNHLKKDKNNRLTNYGKLLQL